MKSPEDVAAAHPAHRARRRAWIIGILIAIVVLLGSLRSLAGLWTDQMWFSSVGKESVFSTLLGIKVGLAVVFGVLFFVGLFVNLLVADRIGRTAVFEAPEDEMVRRFQLAVRPYAKRIYALVAVVLGLAAGIAAIGQWQSWLLFSNAQSFGRTDPQFHKDVGFYVFELPFIEFIISWLFVSLVIMAIITSVLHYLNGGIRGQRVRPRVRPAVKVHLSVLLAMMALVKAVGYYYGRYRLLTSTSGYVEGATYTDVHARLPAIELLFWLSLLAAAILLVNIWRQGWTLPVVALGIWVFVALIVGVAYPAILQAIKVTPAQSSLELPYISRNIAATRAAYGLNQVVEKPFAGSTDLNAQSVSDNAQTLANIRLWDPDPQISQQTFQKLQGLRSYYSFNTLGVDRYAIGGQLTPTLAGVRQINPADLPATSWVNTHLVYTHGTGMALAAANQVQGNGNPVFGVYDVPPVSSSGYPATLQGGVFFGPSQPGYVVVNSKQLELDYQTSAGVNVQNHYQGTGGVRLNGFLRQAAFALRLGDFNLLISNLITDKSRIMFVRDIGTMAQKATPFLSFDANPYPVLVGGHIDWVLDGYTTSAGYPYSQNVGSMQLPQGSGLPSSYNYVRNSVKLVIDAYSGQMTYYDVDATDPMLRAYAAAFPGLFKAGSSMPSELRAHLRYPEDLFAAQAATYGRYHINGAAAFYNAGDAWVLSQTAGAGPPSQTLALTTQTNAQGVTISSGAQRMAPQYQVQALPGTTQQSFVVSEAYVPASTGNNTQNLAAFMMATSDPTNYGRITVYVTPSGQSITGPVMADAQIQQNTTVSSVITPLDQHGSAVLLGNILMVPINNSMIYIRPLYVTSAGNPLPQLKYVIAVYDGHVGIESTLQAALNSVLSAAVQLPTNGSATGGGGSSASSANASAASALLTQAQSAYDEAQKALKNGDLAGYQTAIQTMYQDLLAAQALLGGPTQGSSPTSGTTTTTTTAPATTTTAAPAANSSSPRSSTTSTTSSKVGAVVPAAPRR
jgi:uncharacterized protein